MEKKENSMFTNEELVDNEPNAAILIDALQNIGYDNISAIADIVDNSIDAEATKIQIKLEKGKEFLRIMIVDNGVGMTYETLDQALKLGSETFHDGLSDLGKYGMGLSTAGLALARKTIVYTRNSDENVVYTSMTDVDIIKEQNRFCKVLRRANESEIAFFEKHVQNESGTVVLLEDCIGVKQNTISTLKASIIKHFSRIFRRFMERTEFWVNDTLIVADDPLRLGYEEVGGILISEDDVEVKWKDASGEEQKGNVHVKLVSLSDWGGKENAKKFSINTRTEGFSVLRNNREIAWGFMPPWEGLARSNMYNNFRGELSFSSEMDYAMGVNFRKNGIDMVDSVDATLKALLAAQIKTIKRSYAKATEVTDEEENEHKNAEKSINERSKTLLLPKPKKVKKEPDIHDKSLEDVKEEKKEDDTKKDIKESHVKPEDIYSVAKFDLKHMGETGDIYDVGQIGRKIVVSWNVDHVFYKRFIADNVSNGNIVKFIDFFIYALASAQIEWLADDDTKYETLGTIISTMSTNIRNLLTDI